MAELTDAVRKGRSDGLRALRDRLAESIEVAKPSEVASLARQLSDVLLQLEAMTPAKESKRDDLAARRSSRGATVPDGAEGSKPRRGGGRRTGS